jgi:hypothetical protein
VVVDAQTETAQDLPEAAVLARSTAAAAVPEEEVRPAGSIHAPKAAAARAVRESS